MKFLKWIMFNGFFYGTLTSAHYLGGGQKLAAVLTVVVATFAIIYFLTALLAPSNKDAAVKVDGQISNWWDCLNILFILLVSDLGYNGLVVAMVAELTAYFYLVIVIKELMGGDDMNRVIEEDSLEQQEKTLAEFRAASGMEAEINNIPGEEKGAGK